MSKISLVRFLTLPVFWIAATASAVAPVSEFESLYQLSRIPALADDAEAVVYKVTAQRQMTIQGVARGDYLVVTPARCRDLHRGDLVLVRIPGEETPVLRRVVEATLHRASTKSDSGLFRDRFSTTDQTLVGLVTERIVNDVGAERLIDALPLYTSQEKAALRAGDPAMLGHGMALLAGI